LIDLIHQFVFFIRKEVICWKFHATLYRGITLNVIGTN